MEDEDAKIPYLGADGNQLVVHAYSEEWSYDETHHWHAPSCTHKNELPVKDYAEHNMVDHACTECDYFEATEGLAYVFYRENDVRVTGLGTAKGTDIIIAKKYTHTDGVAYDVTDIDSSAFAGTNITSVFIPNTVTEIALGAFRNCTSLENVVFPKNLATIWSNAFQGCTALTSIALPEGLGSIGGSAFNGCTALTSVSIPDSVTMVNGAAFFGCTALTSVYIGAKKVDNLAFGECKNLNSVTIGENVEKISSTVFQGQYTSTIYNGISITEIKVAEGNTHLKMDGNCLIMDGTTVVFGLNVETAEIPEGVTTIDYFAFAHHTALTSVTFPKSLTTIDWYAFYECSGITSIDLSVCTKLTSIGERAFSSCSNLAGTVTIPDSVTSLGNYAFQWTNIEKVDIGVGVKTVGTRAFYYCSNLKIVTLGANVTTINENAFNNCTNLNTINYSGTTAKWATITKGTNWKSSGVTITVNCTDGTVTEE